MKARYTKPYCEYIKFEVTDDVLAASMEAEEIKAKPTVTPTPTATPAVDPYNGAPNANACASKHWGYKG